MNCTLAIKRLVTDAPTLDAFNTFTSKTDGADKVFRVLTYVGRIILAYINKTGTRSIALSALLQSFSELRVLLRFFGLPKAIVWLESLLLQSKGDVNQLQLMQALSLLIYYPMEHVCFLSKKGFFPSIKPHEASLSRWSSRAWLFYLIVDLYLVYTEWKKLPDTIVSDDKDASVKEKRRLTIKALGIFGDLPLAITWSMEESFLSDSMVGVFGTISSITGISLRLM